MESHLLQMRGLKQFVCLVQRCRTLSHLLQMRGLKRAHQTLECPEHSRIFYRCVD